MSHAVGIAAALVAAGNLPAPAIDPAALRERLRAGGAML